MHKPCGKTLTNNSFIYSPLVNGGGGFTGILEAWGKKLLEIFQMVFLDPPLLRGPAPPWEGPRGLKKQPASSFISFNNPTIQLGLALERFHTCALRKKYRILFMLQFTGSFPGAWLHSAQCHSSAPSSLSASRWYGQRWWAHWKRRCRPEVGVTAGPLPPPPHHTTPPPSTTAAEWGLDLGSPLAAPGVGDTSPPTSRAGSASSW